VQPLEVELIRQTQERRPFSRDETGAGELRPSEALEGLPRRRKAQALVILAGEADELRLEEPGRPGVDQLPAHRFEQRMHDCRSADRAHPALLPHGVADQRVAPEAPQEVAVVVVGREEKTELGERLLGLVALDPGVELSVALLRDAGEDGYAARLVGDREDAVA
jgi:hypothetical protein